MLKLLNILYNWIISVKQFRYFITNIFQKKKKKTKFILNKFIIFYKFTQKLK